MLALCITQWSECCAKYSLVRIAVTISASCFSHALYNITRFVFVIPEEWEQKTWKEATSGLGFIMHRWGTVLKHIAFSFQLIQLHLCPLGSKGNSDRNNCCRQSRGVSQVKTNPLWGCFLGGVFILFFRNPAHLQVYFTSAQTITMEFLWTLERIQEEFGLLGDTSPTPAQSHKDG